MAQQVEYVFGSRKVVAFRNSPDQKWQARLYVNYGETATNTSNKLKTEIGLRNWAAKVMGCNTGDMELREGHRAGLRKWASPIVPPETPRAGRKISLAEGRVVLELFDHKGQNLSGTVVTPALGEGDEPTANAAYLALCHACCGVNVESPEYQEGLIRFIDAEEAEGQ